MSESAARPRRRGRRPAGEDTRGAILSAARAEFGRLGYDATTLRGIARAAGVDPRLVHHYFDGKQDVFVAALHFPARPEGLLREVLDGGIAGIGERLVRAFLAAWEAPDGRQRVLGILRAATSSEAGARMLREFLARELLGPLAAQLDVPDPQLRAGLAASHLIGLGIGRYVVQVEPLAAADREELVRLVAPALERYLTDAAFHPER